MWTAPALQLKWGPYFRDDVAEQAQVIAMTVAALEAQAITKRQAVEKLQSIFHTDNIDDILQQLEDDAKERAEQAMNTAQAGAGAKTLSTDSKQELGQ